MKLDIKQTGGTYLLENGEFKCQHQESVAVAVAVVERDETGQIIWCNHDQGTEFEDVAAPEFDPDSKQYIITGTERIETCGKCHAEFNNITEEWEETPTW